MLRVIHNGKLYQAPIQKDPQVLSSPCSSGLDAYLRHRMSLTLAAALASGLCKSLSIHLPAGNGSPDKLSREFADEHPSAKVIGTDLSPIQPNFVPSNCEFYVEDFNEEWTFGEGVFDLIHARQLNGCVPNWVEFFTRAKR